MTILNSNLCYKDTELHFIAHKRRSSTEVSVMTTNCEKTCLCDQTIQNLKKVDLASKARPKFRLECVMKIIFLFPQPKRFGIYWFRPFWVQSHKRYHIPHNKHTLSLCITQKFTTS